MRMGKMTDCTVLNIRVSTILNHLGVKARAVFLLNGKVSFEFFVKSSLDERRYHENKKK